MAQLANRRLAMTLFSGDKCSYCHMVRIVLAEKGINYDLQNVDQDNTPEELKDLNPYNEVPTLVDRDLVLYESNVIMEYLDERFPHPPLMYRIERDWYSLAKQLRDKTQAVDKIRKELRDSLVSVTPIFEQKPYFMSDEFSLLDCAIAPLLWRLPYFGIELPSAAKALINYAERMFDRDSFKESLTESERELKED
jgi:RNA polymerase-associated protein